jgi:hypothetical protein
MIFSPMTPVVWHSLTQVLKVGQQNKDFHKLLNGRFINKNVMVSTDYESNTSLKRKKIV